MVGLPGSTQTLKPLTGFSSPRRRQLSVAAQCWDAEQLVLPAAVSLWCSGPIVSRRHCLLHEPTPPPALSLSALSSVLVVRRFAHLLEFPSLSQ